jgi:hypothetical protein
MDSPSLERREKKWRQSCDWCPSAAVIELFAGAEPNSDKPLHQCAEKRHLPKARPRQAKRFIARDPLTQAALLGASSSPAATVPDLGRWRLVVVVLAIELGYGCANELLDIDAFEAGDPGDVELATERRILSHPKERTPQCSQNT